MATDRAATPGYKHVKPAGGTRERPGRLTAADTCASRQQTALHRATGLKVGT